MDFKYNKLTPAQLMEAGNVLDKYVNQWLECADTGHRAPPKPELRDALFAGVKALWDASRQR